MRVPERLARNTGSWQTALLPANLVARCWEKVPRSTRITFFSGFVFGILIHAFMFTNKFPNHDDLLYMFTIDTEVNNPLSMMRWFLPLAFRISGTWSTPWLNGILSVFYLAAAACLVTAVMEIERPLHCFLAAGIMVSFPTVASTFSYMMFADAFFLSLLLACFAVFITQKHRYGFIAGIIAIMLSCGIYQAYFAVAAGLAVGSLIVHTVNGRYQAKEIMIRGARLLFVLVSGLMLFSIIARWAAADMPISSAYGFSSMGVPADEFLARLGNIQEAIGDFYYRDRWNVHFSFMKYGFVAAAVASVILLLLITVRKKLRSVKEKLLLAALVVIYIYSSYLILVITTFPPHSLMIYSLALLPLMGIALMDLFAETAKQAAQSVVKSARRNLLHDGMTWVGTACCLILTLVIGASIWSYNETSNKAYLKMHIVYENTYAYSIRLIRAIEDAENYTTDMPVVCVGRPIIPNNADLAGMMDEDVRLTGVVPAYHLTYLGAREYYPLQLFLKTYVGWDKIIYRTGSAVSDRYKVMKEVQDMAVYPLRDSVKVMDGMVVVRFE